MYRCSVNFLRLWSVSPEYTQPSKEIGTTFF